SEEHTSELQSRFDIVCRLLLEKKKRQKVENDGPCNRNCHYKCLFGSIQPQFFAIHIHSPPSAFKYPSTIEKSTAPYLSLSVLLPGARIISSMAPLMIRDTVFISVSRLKSPLSMPSSMMGMRIMYKPSGSSSSIR